MGLVGESGCGKTTLARAILGVLPRETARITRRPSLRSAATDLLTADPAAVDRDGARPRHHLHAAGPVHQSFNPLFTVGDADHGTDEMEVAARRRAAGRGWLPAVVSRYPAERRRWIATRCWSCCDAVQMPRAGRRCCASIRTSSPAASASG